MSPARVAVLCDYAEENWPSMEAIAGMLLEHLNAPDLADIRATRIQPVMRRRFGHLNADRLINRFWYYPRVASRLRGYDLFHLMDHSYAHLVHSLVEERTVVTCHDTETFRCLLEPAKERRAPWFRAMVRHTLRGLEKAATIICVSDATRRRLLAYKICAPERIHVVYNGIHPCFNPAPKPPVDAAISRLLGARGGVTELLHVGNTTPRKRIDVLLRVFAECRQWNRKLRLIRVGSAFSDVQREMLRRLKIEDSTIWLGSLDSEMLAAVYRRAALVLVTSEAEGFGLPLAESMACSTPVVASDIPALREVGGDMATYCGVAEIGEWAESIRGLLSERRENAMAWGTRQGQAHARASTFSWDRNARDVADIYRAVLSRS